MPHYAVCVCGSVVRPFRLIWLPAHSIRERKKHAFCFPMVYLAAAIFIQFDSDRWSTLLDKFNSPQSTRWIELYLFHSLPRLFPFLHPTSLNSIYIRIDPSLIRSMTVHVTHTHNSMESQVCNFFGNFFFLRWSVRFAADCTCVSYRTFPAYRQRSVNDAVVRTRVPLGGKSMKSAVDWY